MPDKRHSAHYGIMELVWYAVRDPIQAAVWNTVMKQVYDRCSPMVRRKANEQVQGQVTRKKDETWERVWPAMWESI